MKSDGKTVQSEPPVVLWVGARPKNISDLQASLQRQADAVGAASLEEGLDVLDHRSEVAVVIAPFRAVGLNGVKFLSLVRKQRPRAVQVLTAASPDAVNAITTANRDGIFRVMLTPMSARRTITMVEDALAQYRLKSVEADLLEKTLCGTVRALVQTLSEASPARFGRLVGIQNLAFELAVSMGAPNPWISEVAVALSHLGAMALPEELVRMARSGQPMSVEQSGLAQALPLLSLGRVEPIPRLEQVCDVIRGLDADPALSDDVALACTRIALAYDALRASGMKPDPILELFRGGGDYRTEIIDALHSLKVEAPRAQVKEIGLLGLRVGMKLLEDLRTPGGLLLLGKNQEVTRSLIRRLWNLPPGRVREPFRVEVPPEVDATLDRDALDPRDFDIGSLPGIMDRGN